jgi:hypothetical protein
MIRDHRGIQAHSRGDKARALVPNRQSQPAASPPVLADPSRFAGLALFDFAIQDPCRGDHDGV